MGRRAGERDVGERLKQAAGRTFRTGGFGGAGVDAIAREAGFTSGAFYSHFGSKAAAFREALRDGLDILIGVVLDFQAEHGDGWLPRFVDFYLGARLNLGLEEACALPTLSNDVARADEETRRVYTESIDRLAAAIANGLVGENRRERALRLIAILAGSAGIARAVSEPELRAAMVSAASELARRA